MLPEALGLVSAVEVTASTADERARWCRLLHLHQMLRQRAILDVRLPLVLAGRLCAESDTLRAEHGETRLSQVEEGWSRLLLRDHWRPFHVVPAS